MSGIVRAFALTPLQEGMLYHALRHPGSGLYHGQLVATLDGPLDRRLFEHAWRLAVERHEIFRTFFTWEGRDRPLQVVRRHVDLPIDFVDWSSLAPSEVDTRWSAMLADDRSRAFDLTAAPLMRMTVVRREEEVHHFLWGVHHSILDGWSGELVLGEVLDDLETLRRGGSPDRPPAPSYAEFVGWLESRDSAEARRWWTAELSGVRHPTPLPLAGRAEAASTERHTAERRLDAHTTARIRATAAQRRVTLATLTVAAWATLLSRRTGHREPVFGITMSERPADIPGVHNAAGLYLDTIPVRIRMPEHASIATWLPDVQRGLSEARARGSLGLGALKRLSDVEGPDLVRSLVVFENFPDSLAHEGARDGLRIRTVEMSGPSDLPLALLVYPGERLSLQLVHDPAQITHRQAQDLLSDLAGILAGFDVDGTVDEVVARTEPATVGNEDREAVPVAWTQGTALPEPPEDVVDLIRRQVEAHPDRDALRFGNEALTYRELDRRSDALARVVAARTEPGAHIGLMAPRSIDAIVAMLGVLKANRCYIPLDPDLPAARLEAMTASAALVLLAPGANGGALSGPTLSLDDVAFERVGSPTRSEAGGPGPEAEVEPAAPHDAAYIIHTSGSTGLPKGVVVERRHLAWSTAARLGFYSDHPGVFLLLSPITVDSSIAGIYWTLCAGGTLCLAPHRGEQDVIALGALIQDHGVTHTLLVPSLYRALLEEVEPSRLTTLGVVVVAGEACGVDVVRTHHALLPGSTLYNEYGPSEASVWATVDRLSPDDGEVTIGRPVPGARAWVIAEGDRPARVGEAGELVLGGPGVVRGYLGQPEAAELVFGSHPEHGRTYRTGDRARWRSDGRLDFLGRIDHQIKVRGHRIEAGEVERVLVDTDGVREAVVALDERSGRPTLTAWITLDGSPGEADLRASLARILPDYMIPARFAVVDELPRTVAGKIDRSAIAGLSTRGLEPPTARDIVLPRTPVEATLAAVWREVLGVDEIGVHDDFFMLGGDSLLSIRVLSRAAREGLRVDPEAFFERPTIAHLAALLLPEQDADVAPVTGSAPLLPIQHWFVETITEGAEPWNQTVMLRLSAAVAPTRVEAAFARLLAHHEALRLRLERAPGGWRQVIAEPAPEIPFRVVDLSAPGDGAPRIDDEAARVDDEAARVDDEANREHGATDPARGDLFRAVLFRSSTEQRLLLVAHHLVIDAVSWGIVLDDLATLLSAGEDATLPARSASLLEWASALRERAERPEVRAMADYWTSSAPSDDSKRVPVDSPGAGHLNRVASGVVRTLTLDEDRTMALSVSARRPGSQRLHEMLLAALALALARWTGRLECRFDVEGLGRDTLRGSLDPSRTVGWFTSAYPLGLRLDGPDAVSALAAVSEAASTIPLGGAAYGLLRYLHPDSEVREAMRAAGGSNLLFNFLGSVDRTIAPAAPFERLEGLYGEPRGGSLPRAYAIEINARIEQGRLTFAIEYSSALHVAESIEVFTRQLDRALGDLADEVGDGPGESVPGNDLPDENAFPLSPMQELMLLHELGAQGRGVLVSQTCYAVRGALHRAAFEDAVSHLMARHPALRTCFVWDGLDEPLQVVRPSVSPVVDWVDLVDRPSGDRDAEAEAIRVADASRPFDIRCAPLVRFTVVQTGGAEALLIGTVHHLIADRWSATHLMSELGHLYRSIAGGESIDLEPAPRFRDYIAWLQDRDPAASDYFWRERLAGLRQPSRLSPGGTSEPRREAAERTTTVHALDASLLGALTARAAEARLGPAAIVLGALALETARRSGRRDVAFGLTVAGRPPDLVGVEAMVGSFVNNVPATFRIDPAAPIAPWLRALQLDQLRRQPHEHVSLARLHGLSSLPHHEPLFDLLVVVNLDEVDDFDFGDVRMHPERATLAGGYPLVLQVAQTDGILSLTLVHSLAAADAEALLDDLAHAITTLVHTDPEATLASVIDLEGLPDTSAETGTSAEAGVVADRAGAPAEAPRGANEAPRGDEALRGANEAVRAAWTDVLGVSSARHEDDFFALGGTSLQGVRLLARIEIELGVRVPIATLVSGRTLGSLLDAVDAPVEVGPLVVIRSAGSAAPLIAVPGVKGNLLLYPQLAEHLRADRPVFGLQSRGVDGDGPLLGTMREIAEDFADQLAPFLGRPFHLFGLCWGAAAAFEVAAVLEARGTPPASIGLLDPTALGIQAGADGRSTTGGRVGFVLDRLSVYWDEFQTLDWAGRREMVSTKTSRVADAIRGRTPEETRQELRTRAVVEANLRALVDYRPASVSTPSRLFLAQDHDPGDRRDHRLEWLGHFDPAASRVILPGFDSGDVINTHTGALAEALDRWLDEVEQGPL